MDGLTRWLLGTALSVGALAAVLALATLALALVLHGRPGWRKAVADALLVGSVALVAFVTLVPAPIGQQPDRINLLPFRDLIWAIQGTVDGPLAVAGLAGNVALFMPLGTALAIRFPNRSWVWLALAGLACSLGVEVGQAILPIGRLADVTDLLANAAGTALGVGVVRSWSPRQAGPQTSGRES